VGPGLSSLSLPKAILIVTVHLIPCELNNQTLKYVQKILKQKGKLIKNKAYQFGEGQHASGNEGQMTNFATNKLTRN